MMRTPGLRSATISMVFLMLAGLLALALLVFVRPDADPRPSNGARAADLTIAVRQAEGPDGAGTLSLFGDDAAELFEDDRAAFRELMKIVKLDRPARRLSAGPWREAVFQWARARRLGPYVNHLGQLGPDQWERLRKAPGCLPLLGRGARMSEAMLTRYGAQAWRLFSVVDIADELDGVERTARALDIVGDVMLGVNESHGPTLAMLFVAPPGDDSGLLPRLFEHAVRRLGVEVAGALFLGNYDDLVRLALEERRPYDDLVRAVDRLIGQPEPIQAMAADSGLVVRLLLEHRGGEPIGLEILSRCGPEAADLLYAPGGYAGRSEDRAAALSILRHCGEEGVELLRTCRDNDSWRKLLRREELMDGDVVPLIVRIAVKLGPAPDRREAIGRYLEMPRQQIVEEDIPPGVAARVLEWVPGYVTVRTAYDAARGYRVETSEVAWAVLDGMATVTFVGKLAGQALKTVGRQTARAQAEAAIRSIRSRALSEIAANHAGEAARTMMTRLPGALASFTKLLPTLLPTLDVTAVARSASVIAKKVGVRTWDKLDRRIIMRRDRMVVIAPFNKDVVRLVGSKMKDAAIAQLNERIKKSFEWETAPEEVGEFALCILERVVPGLGTSEEDWSSLPSSARDAGGRRPTFAVGITATVQTVGMILIVACLAIAIPWVRRTAGRAFTSQWRAGVNPTADRPRTYWE